MVIKELMKAGVTWAKRIAIFFINNVVDRKTWRKSIVRMIKVC